MRVVTCPKQLVLHIDALMLNPMAGTREEKLLCEWWSRCAPDSRLQGRREKSQWCEHVKSIQQGMGEETRRSGERRARTLRSR